MFLRYCARSVPVLLLALLSACRGSRFRVESANGDISIVRGRIHGPLSAGASLREGDNIETGQGGAVIAVGDDERFEVYPRSVVVLRGGSQGWWPRAGQWLSRLKRTIGGIGEHRPLQPGWLPVIAVRG